MPANTRLHTELLITAGVRGLDHIDSVIDALRAAGQNTDQLTEESARLRAEWDSLDPEERARRLRDLAEATNQARDDANGLADSAERNVGAFNRLKVAVAAFGAALGVAFVAGKNRVPRPAAGITALVIDPDTLVMQTAYMRRECPQNKRVSGTAYFTIF